MNGPEIHVVLTNTIYPRNIGYCARAVANMGAKRLILVDPKCELDYEARQGAAGAQMILLESSIYASWDEFYAKEPEGLRIAFCARKNHESDDLSYAERLKAVSRFADARPVYLIFGPEDRGLSNDDLKFANFIVSLPTFGAFTSMNLSHAVMLALYLTREHLRPESASATAGNSHTEGDFVFPEEALGRWLTTLGFEIGDRRTDAYRVIKRILLSNLSTAKELRVLEAVIQQTIRKLGG